MPLANERHGRHAVHRNRHSKQRRGRNAPNRTAQSATHTCSGQHSFLPSTDVEWALLVQLGRPVQQLLGLPLSSRRKMTRNSRQTIRSSLIYLIAQAHIPPTELVEVAGFTGTAGTIGPRFDAFDDGKGGIVPAPDASGFRNEPIRQAVLDRLNGSANWRALFGRVFPSVADWRSYRLHDVWTEPSPNSNSC